jgi:hypothetical protein
MLKTPPPDAQRLIASAHPTLLVSSTPSAALMNEPVSNQIGGLGRASLSSFDANAQLHLMRRQLFRHPGRLIDVEISEEYYVPAPYRRPDDRRVDDVSIEQKFSNLVDMIAGKAAKIPCRLPT